MLPKPPKLTAVQWLESVIEEGGVLAALPYSLWRSGATSSNGQLRIGSLSSTSSVGQASFWSQDRPLEAEYGDAFNAWFPPAHEYDPDISSLEWDQLTLAGVTYRACDGGARDAGLLQLEAAARGIGPAILARVHHGVFTQLQSFKLSDMLSAYSRLLGNPLRRPSRGSLEASIYEVTMSCARKIRALADARILKLDMTPDAVVFCPHLYETETGELEESGYGFEGLQSIKGVPYLNGFDTELCKKVPASVAEYDADAAYLMMTLLLLANVKAAHGQAPFKLMMHKLLGRTTGGADLPANALPPGFERISLRQVSERASEAKSTAEFCAIFNALGLGDGGGGGGAGGAIDAACKDLHEIVQSRLLDNLWRGGKSSHHLGRRNVFEELVQELQDSSDVVTDIFSSGVPPTESLDALERTAQVEHRLMAVVEARVARKNQ